MKEHREGDRGGRGRRPTTHTLRRRVGRLRPLFLEGRIRTQHGELRLPAGRSKLQPQGVAGSGWGWGPGGVVGVRARAPRSVVGPSRQPLCSLGATELCLPGGWEDVGLEKHEAGHNLLCLFKTKS